MIRTYLLDSRSLPDPLVSERLLAGLQEDRKERIMRQKRLSARRQDLGTGMLLNYVLQQTGCSEKAVVRYNHYGKPILDQISFNLSHSGDYIILSIQEPLHRYTEKCVSDTDMSELPYIGCDIEQVKTYAPKIARRFFTDNEYQNLEHMNQEAQAELFFRYWTRKESVLKLTGLGMALPMDLFDVSAADQAVIDAEKVDMWYYSSKEKKLPEYEQAYEILLAHTLYFKDYCYDGYCITVCSTQNEFAAELYDDGDVSELLH